MKHHAAALFLVFVQLPAGAVPRVGWAGGRGTDRHQFPGRNRQPSGVQREKLLWSGVGIREIRPDPAVLKEPVGRYPKLKKKPPTFALHAKTLVIDGETPCVGTLIWIRVPPT
ncbi:MULTISPECIES: hypothetical protein [Geobacter]|uniref:hypothetical protein n=1 Tax=Geobacter TaxID=28231 RepID=UPI0025724750|nr:hypothetical protein [Geobacter sulfurreducens]BET59783.1 hypothetical protein GEO60473_28230 [Geobacter sp. 60473]